MSLIKLEGNIEYLDIVYPEGITRSLRYSMIKRLNFDAEMRTPVLVMSNDVPKEFKYWEIEDSTTPGEAFTSGLSLLTYLSSLLQMDIGL